MHLGFLSIVIGVVVAGCQDPTIDVRIVVPTAPHDYAARLASISVSVVATSMTCDDAAYGLIDEDDLEFGEVAGATAEPGGSLALDGVPRLGPKLFIAEGRDADGERVIGGCAPLGDVEDDVVVEIVTEAIGDLVVAPHPADQPAPAELAVFVDDGYVVPEPLPGRGVRWTVRTCPDEDSTSGTADDTDDVGATTIALAAPPGYGPRPIEIRARWAEPQPAVVSTFQGPLGVDRPIGGTCPPGLTIATADWHPLRLPGGLVGMAGLGRGGGASHLYVAVWDGDASLQGCSADVGDVAGVAVVRGGAGAPDTLAVIDATDVTRYGLAADGSGGIAVTVQGSRPWTNPTGVVPRAVTGLRACGAAGGDGDVILTQLADDSVLAFRPDGMESPDHPFAAALELVLPTLAEEGMTPELAGSGCIAGGEDPAVPAVLLEASRLIVDDPSTLRPRDVVVDATAAGLGFVTIPVPSFGAVGFTPVRESTDAYLLGGLIHPSGPKVVRWRLTRIGDSLQLREDRIDDALGPPASIAYGDLDGDGLGDTIWGLVDAVAGGVEESRVQIALACGEGAVNGVSPTLAVGAAAVFLAPEEDGTSDVMLGGSGSAVFVDTD